MVSKNTGKSGDLSANFDTSHTIKDVQINFPGVALGKVYVLDMPKLPEPDLTTKYGSHSDNFYSLDDDAQTAVKDSYVKEQRARFIDAREAVKATFTNIYETVTSSIPIEMKGDADFMVETEFLMAMDDHSPAIEFINAAIEDGHSAEAAVQIGLQQCIDFYETMDDEGERKKTEMFRHQLSVYQHHLMGTSQEIPSLVEATPGSVIYAREITPANVMTSLDPKTGKPRFPIMITTSGSLKGHSAVIAKAMGIIFVIIPEDKLPKNIKNGTWLAVDGPKGEVVIQPNAAKRAQYEKYQKAMDESVDELLARSQNTRSLRTLDGNKIRVLANYGASMEAQSLKAAHPSGIGLYRTEAAENLRVSEPITEELWYEIFKENLLKVSKDGRPFLPITVRSLDIAGDKGGRYADKTPAQKKAIEWETAKLQFAALLRLVNEEIDGKKPNIKIMIPMIRDAEHMQQFQDLMNDQAKKMGVKPIELGCMIEVPSLLLNMNQLKTAFISIGSNDFIHKLLDIDRYSDESKDEYDPTHPSVLEAFSQIIEHGRKKDIDISICGDVASDPKFTTLLIGAGLTNLSAGVSAIPFVKEMTRRIDSREAKLLFDKIKATVNRPERERLLMEFNATKLGLRPNGTLDMNWKKPEGPSQELVKS